MEKTSLDMLFADEKNQIDKVFELASTPGADMTQVQPKVLELYFDVILLDKWYMHYRIKRTVIDLFMKRKEDEDPTGKGISLATAYRRFDLMERVFGVRHRSNKEYKRAYYIDWFTRLLKKAEDSGNYIAAASLGKVLIGLEALDEKEDISQEMLEMSIPVIMGYFPETVGDRMTEEEANKLRSKLTKKRRQKEEDDDFEILE